MVILRLIGDEDHRVRNAVASCLVALVRMWTTSTCSPDLVRLKQLSSALKRDDSGDNGVPKFAGVSLFSINGLAEAYRDVPTNDDVGANLTFFVEEILQLLVTSNSKFTKVFLLMLSPNLNERSVTNFPFFSLLRWAVSSHYPH